MAKKYLTLDNTRTIFQTNFSGRVNEYNEKGYRQINVVIPEDRVEEFQDAGLLVKVNIPKDDPDAEPTHYVKTNISYRYSKPSIAMIEDGYVTDIVEETISDLDEQEIIGLDITITPSYWSRNGREGYTAYARSMNVYVETDPTTKIARDMRKHQAQRNMDEDIPF